MISNQLIDRLSHQAALNLADKVRKDRRHALSSISRCCVVLTDDGRGTREVIFDQPPTIRQLEVRVGPDAGSDRGRCGVCPEERVGDKQ